MNPYKETMPKERNEEASAESFVSLSIENLSQGVAELNARIERYECQIEATQAICNATINARNALKAALNAAQESTDELSF